VSYQRYTFCVTRSEFDALDAASFIGPAITIVAGIIAAIFTGPVGVIVAAIGGLWAIEKVCHFLLGGKLICLGQDDACAIGRVAQIEPVGYGKSGFERIDNDFSVNLLLAPHSPEATREQIEGDGLQGTFMAQKNPETSGLGFVGYATDNRPDVEIPVFHTEFEGSRIHDFCETAPAALAVFTIATAIGVAICFIPVVGWIACVIAIVAGALIGAAVAGGMIIDAWNDALPGSAKDAEVGPGDGDLHAMDPDTNEGGDYVIIRGRWCYDAGHSGWNELHPARSVQKIPPSWDQGSDESIVKAFEKERDRWCRHTGYAEDPEVKEQQAEPENDWVCHPALDGCRPQQGEPDPDPGNGPH
jgi:hypothetical protein